MDESLKRIESQLKWLQYVTAGAVGLSLLIVTIVMIFTMWNTYRLGQQAQAVRDVVLETHDSLCAFKLNIIVTQRDAIKFRNENPGGLKDARGNVLISRDQIDQGITNRQNTLNSLLGLDCEGETIQ